jgi:hypothetical protein
VAAELDAARLAVGSGIDVAAFMKDAIRMARGVVTDGKAVSYNLTETPRGLRELVGRDTFTARYEPPVKDQQVLLTRTHPLVEAVAAWVMNSALDEAGNDGEANGTARARRAGAIRTTAVQRRTTLLLVRFRYHLITRVGDEERQLMAEDSLTLAFEGAPENAQWLEPEAAEALLNAAPEENIHPEDAARYVGKVIEGFAHLAPTLNAIAEQRGQELLAAHERVREAAYRRGDRRPQHRVEAQLPPDVLGIYVFLPAPGKV